MLTVPRSVRAPFSSARWPWCLLMVVQMHLLLAAVHRLVLRLCRLHARMQAFVQCRVRAVRYLRDESRLACRRRLRFFGAVQAGAKLLPSYERGAA